MFKIFKAIWNAIRPGWLLGRLSSDKVLPKNHIKSHPLIYSYDDEDYKTEARFTRMDAESVRTDAELIALKAEFLQHSEKQATDDNLIKKKLELLDDQEETSDEDDDQVDNFKLMRPLSHGTVDIIAQYTQSWANTHRNSGNLEILKHDINNIQEKTRNEIMADLNEVLRDI